MTALLSICALITAFLHIRSEQPEPRSPNSVFKTVTTSLLILVAAAAGGLDGAPYKNLVIAGMFFALMGDIFLMFPPGWVVFALSAYLVAPVFYLVAFTADTAFVFSPWTLLPMAVYSSFMLGAVGSWADDFRGPIILYGLLLAVMGWRALERLVQLEGIGAAVGFAGATLLIVSASILGWNRFVRSFPHGHMATLATYFISLWLIALSV